LFCIDAGLSGLELPPGGGELAEVAASRLVDGKGNLAWAVGIRHEMNGKHVLIERKLSEIER
jgi:hypothetical protein